MQGTARVHNATGIGQLLHEESGAAGMIEMDVREEHEVDVGNLKIALSQRVDQQRDAVVRSGVDEGGPTTTSAPAK